MKLHLELDVGDLARIQGTLERLAESTRPKVISRAINEAIDRSATEAVRRIGEKLPALAKARIRRDVRKFSTNLATLAGDIQVSQSGIPLINFAVGTSRSIFRRARRLKGAGATLTRVPSPTSGVFVTLQHGRKPVKGGFLQVASGALAIFRRSGAPQPRKRGRGGEVRPRTPIEFLYGPSVFDVFQDDVEAVRDFGAEIMLRELERQIDLALG